MSSESTPLMPPSAGGGSTSSYYFLRQNSDQKSYDGGGGESVTRDADGGEVLESLPNGASSQEFAPRAVMTPSPKPHGRKRAASVASANNGSQNNDNGGFFKKIFSGRNKANAFEPKGQGFGTLVKERKAPIKVEPKVFFANERTFLAWLHTAIMLAGASIAIVAFADANPWSQLYGVILLPVAIAFIVYAMVQYTRRANMIRRKEPGPFEDTVGPTVLGILLMLSIVAQFAIKLYSMM